MIHVENLSFSFPDQELYNSISFSIEEGDHAVLIGSNGTGKSTLLEILQNPEAYLFKGTVTLPKGLRTGCVYQLTKRRKDRGLTVFQFLCEDFDKLQARMNALGEAMADSKNPEAAADAFQACMDEFDALDGYNAEYNILKRLHSAGLTYLKDTPLSEISGGEYQLVQIIREMLRKPEFLILDEPDAFLDFENLDGLRELVNTYPGTLLAVTHCRFLLNHCFNRILHLEDGALHEFEGNYAEYGANLLRMKLTMLQANAKEEEWLRIQEAVVERLRKEATEVISPTKGRALHARVSYLERLTKSKTPVPFTEDKAPLIRFPAVRDEDGTAGYGILADGYSLRFDELLLDKVSFNIGPKEKVALVGPNGAGKSTLLREIRAGTSDHLTLGAGIRAAFLSQLHGETLDEKRSIFDIFYDAGLHNKNDIRAHLGGYCLPADILDRKIDSLSGGEKNLLQLALIALSDANFLLLDEPSGHLDLYAQAALINAVNAFDGGVLMVSHDFYSIADCVDYILFVDGTDIRRMSNRAFRKMIYKNHYSKDYLFAEQEKKNLEFQINAALRRGAYPEAEKLLDKLDGVLERMKS